jgi:hypothetical protein
MRKHYIRSTTVEMSRKVQQKIQHDILEDEEGLKFQMNWFF